MFLQEGAGQANNNMKIAYHLLHVGGLKHRRSRTLIKKRFVSAEGQEEI